MAIKSDAKDANAAPAVEAPPPAPSPEEIRAQQVRENPLFLLPVQSYLETTVMSVVTDGLEDLCRARPANPIDYLALYFLRRSQANNVVEVPYNDAEPAVPVRTL